jgi:hypothetical protein
MLHAPDDKAPRFSSQARARLSAVLQTAKDLVTIEDAMKALQTDRSTSAKLLSRWQQQGWLKRVGRGIYAPIPLDALATEQVLKDPWVLVPALYAPAYIGGWTAAEHWDLTEQLFRSIFVFTARSFRKKEQTVQGASFQLTHISEDALRRESQSRTNTARSSTCSQIPLRAAASGMSISACGRTCVTPKQMPKHSLDTATSSETVPCSRDWDSCSRMNPPMSNSCRLATSG